MCDFRFRSPVRSARRGSGLCDLLAPKETSWQRISAVCPAGRNGEPPTRLPSLRFPKFQLGPDCNLDHTVAPFSEDLIRLVDLIKCERVREEWGQIQSPMPDQFHQP